MNGTTFEKQSVAAPLDRIVRKRPTGFLAKCQCGAIISAVDYIRIDKGEFGILCGMWLHSGYAVLPMFGDSWKVELEQCKCGK